MLWWNRNVDSGKGVQFYIHQNYVVRTKGLNKGELQSFVEVLFSVQLEST